MNIYKVIAKLPPVMRRHKLVKLLLFISPNSRIQLIQFNKSAKLFADITDPNPRNYLITQTFEPDFFLIAKPFLAKGGVFFDVGANFGFCSFGLMGCLSDVDIEYHLFEANKNIYELLLMSKELQFTRNMYINHCCVTDKDGVSKLNIVKENLGQSFISKGEGQEVNNITLDKYIDNKSVKKINFMKIDIEGWEPFALKGTVNSLTSGRVDTLYIEISSINLARNGFVPKDCFKLLQDAGFDLFYCKPSDFESKIVNPDKIFNLNINGHSLRLAYMDKFPEHHQSDILAIHKQAEFFQNHLRSGVLNN
ncbi:MAG: FkbM family methyltransferase [Phormidium sp.]